ncbi:hypothetical protein Tco_0040732 [Tanacetum coccineum]
MHYSLVDHPNPIARHPCDVMSELKQEFVERNLSGWKGLCIASLEIIEQRVKVNQKAHILELKRRNHEKYCSDNLYAVSIKEDTANGNIKGKESGGKKEKNKHPKVRPTMVQPKPQRHNIMVKAAEFWKKFVFSTSRTRKGVGSMLGEIYGHSWNKQNTRAAWRKPFNGIRFGFNGGYDSGSHYYWPIRRESQRVTLDPGII